MDLVSFFCFKCLRKGKALVDKEAIIGYDRDKTKALSEEKGMKKLKIVFIILLLVISFVACSKKDKDATPVGDTDQQANPSKEVIEEPQKSEVVETINYEKEIVGGTKVIVPGENGLVNNSFEDELTGWELIQMAHTVEVSFPGNNQLYLAWNKEDDTGVVLKQTPIILEQSKKYQVKFEAMAKQPSSIQIIVRNEADASIIYTDTIFDLTDQKGLYIFEFMMNDEMDTQATFEVHWPSNVSGQVIELGELSLSRVIGDLVWADEFDYTGLPAAEKWAGDVGGNGWGNGELQYYTGVVENNVWVEDGRLTITAKKEEKGSNHYTSARLTTLSKAKWAFGRIEVKAKLPEGVGTWPAIWMLSTGNKYGNWPGSGEIDIMENVGHDMDNIHGSFHSATYNWRGNQGQKTGSIIAKHASKLEYTYTLEWTPTQMDLYVDDHLFLTYFNEGTGYKSWPFDETFYLILNIAIGGGWGGQKGIDDSIFPQKMEIDYVRVYDLGIDMTDNVPPDPVVDLAYEMKGTSLYLTWKSTYDNYGIKSFEIYKDGQLIGTNKVREFVIKDFDTTQKHIFEVVAVDGAGNISEPSVLEYSN